MSTLRTRQPPSPRVFALLRRGWSAASVIRAPGQNQDYGLASEGFEAAQMRHERSCCSEVVGQSPRHERRSTREPSTRVRWRSSRLELVEVISPPVRHPASFVKRKSAVVGPHDRQPITGPVPVMPRPAWSYSHRKSSYSESYSLPRSALSESSWTSVERRAADAAQNHLVLLQDMHVIY